MSKQALRPRHAIIAIIFLIILSFFWGAAQAQESSGAAGETPAASPAAAPSPAEQIDAEKLIKDIWAVNNRFLNYEAEIHMVRLNDDFLKNVLPPSADPRYLNITGIISYERIPKSFRLSLSEESRKRFYFEFGSQDGYTLTLKSKFKTAPVQPSITPSPAVNPEVAKLTDFKLTTQGDYESSAQNPLNLAFPFPFKPMDPAQKTTYMGKQSVGREECYVIRIESSAYGNSRVYITADKNRDVVKVERLDDNNEVYAEAYYKNFHQFLKGGRLHLNCDILVKGEPEIKLAMVESTLVSNQEKAPDAGGQGTDNKAEKNKEILFLGAPAFTVGMVFFILLLLSALVVIGYRFWFFKSERPAFNRELIIVEGTRPEDQISAAFTQLGFKNTPFTPQILTGERDLLDFKKKNLPRVVVIGPGMSSQTKAYNFLIKTYVRDGGRVIIFDHGMEQASDMPLSPTFIPYDKSDPHNTFAIMPNWEKIWKLTSPEEIQKRTQAFLPYELLSKFQEENVEVDPIIVVTNQRTKLTAAAVCIVKEGKGEYLIVQYRLLEAIKKLKFTSATAEKILKDLLEYMFGRQLKLLWAPEWLLSMLGVAPQQKEEEKPKNKKKK